MVVDFSTFPSELNEKWVDLLVLFGEVDDGGDGVDLVHVLPVLFFLLVLAGGLLDDGADELLVEDGLCHLADVDGIAPEEELL